MPRSRRPARAAAKDVIFRTASSSGRSFSSRTYVARMRAVEAQPRGWDFSSEKMPSVAAAPGVRAEGDEAVLQRRPDVVLVSCMKKMQDAFARSARTMSISASRGSFF